MKRRKKPYLRLPAGDRTAPGALYDAVVAAAVSGLRPVVKAAATTLLGIIPLLPDVFWVAMAVTTMFRLAVATLLTRVAVPVFYATHYRLPSPAAG